MKGRKGSALSTPRNDKSILVTTSRQSITIPVTLYKTENGKIAETTALVDSGAVAYTPPAMVFFFLFLFAPLFAAFLLTVYIALCKPGCAISAADTSSV